MYVDTLIPTRLTKSVQMQFFGSGQFEKNCRVWFSYTSSVYSSKPCSGSYVELHVTDAQYTYTHFGEQKLGIQYNGFIWWEKTLMNSPSSNLASFPGHRRNGLETSVSSNCIFRFTQAVNIGLVHDTNDFSSCENGAALFVEAIVCIIEVKRCRSNKNYFAELLH